MQTSLDVQRQHQQLKAAAQQQQQRKQEQWGPQQGQQASSWQQKQGGARAVVAGARPQLHEVQCSARREAMRGAGAPRVGVPTRTAESEAGKANVASTRGHLELGMQHALGRDHHRTAMLRALDAHAGCPRCFSACAASSADQQLARFRSRSVLAAATGAASCIRV